MKKIVLLFILFVLAGCHHQPNPEQLVGPQVCFNDACFEVEIADDYTERQRGLMWREEMADDAGMLFIFDDMVSKRGFWMKNTLIPLDIIWLDDQRKIVHIEQDVPPCVQDPCPSYGPDDVMSKYVVEINAGKIDALASEIGDEVVIKGLGIGN